MEITSQDSYRTTFETEADLIQLTTALRSSDGFAEFCKVSCFSFLFKTYEFKVDRPQTTVVAKNLSVLQLFISRMPKMCAILQLVSAWNIRQTTNQA